jgi:hypothetical protein
MSDEPKEGVKPTTATNDDPLSALSPEAKELFKQVNAGLLSALQKERDAHDAAEKKAAALEKAQQEVERKRLEESQQYKELYDKAQAELSGLKPKAEQIEAYEATMKEILDAQVAELPDEFKDIVPDGLSTKQKLDWLAKNKAKFMKAEPYDIGAGKRGVKPDKKVELTPEERELKTIYAPNMSDEEFAKHKQ